VTDPWAVPQHADAPDGVPYVVDAAEFSRGWRPPRHEPVEEVVRRHLTPFLGAALLLPLLGAPVAYLWRAVTPHVGIIQTAAGPQPSSSESNQFFAIDGWFVLTTLAVGFVVGLVAWFFLRGRGPAGAAGLAFGSLAASAVTAIVGARLVLDSYMTGVCADRDGTVYDGTLKLRAVAAVVAWPVASLLAFAMMTLTRERDEY
jgi:hypothetical protein